MGTMMDSSEMEMIGWEGDYGLPSMDVECTRLMLYMRFTKAAYKLARVRNPLWHPILPTLNDGHITAGYAKCVEQLRFKRYSLDFGQSIRSCSEMYAFGVLVIRALEPVLEYVIWIDKANFEDFTRLWYTKVLPPLVNILYIQKRRQRALNLVKAQENLDEEIYMKELLKKNARECFDILSTRLGSNEFFYGTSPSSLDCTVYACLAPLLKIPFPSDEFTRLLKTFPTLVEYVHRIDHNYQPELLNAKPRILPQKEVTSPGDDSSCFKLKIFSTIFVACAMIGFAFSNKIGTFNK